MFAIIYCPHTATCEVAVYRSAKRVGILKPQQVAVCSNIASSVTFGCTPSVAVFFNIATKCSPFCNLLQYFPILQPNFKIFQILSKFGCSIGKYCNKTLQKISHLVSILKILQPRGATEGHGRSSNEENCDKICRNILTLFYFPMR